MRTNDAQTAFVECLDRHRGILIKVAGACCRDLAGREDLIAEIVAQLWRAYGRFDERAAFSTWMYRIAVNVAISFRRAEMRKTAAARQLFELRSLDYDEPVVAIQDRLQGLRLARIRATMGTLLFAPLMWVPLLIVATRAFLGIDIYAAASPAWLTANVLFGLAVIPTAVVIARAFGPRLERSTPMRFLADEIAGRSLAAALDDLAAIRRFAEEG
jgi:RNA polymerase sigma factor (sigma-70 family)